MATPRTPLKYVDPSRPRSRFSRAYAALSATRLGRFFSAKVVWKLDPYLLRATRGRLGMSLTLPTALLETRGAKTGAFDEAPVDVSLAKETAKNVLSVPVDALLALAEGGYAVEVVNADGSTRLVRVEPSMYADSLVEIKSSGLKEGTKVVVPA